MKQNTTYKQTELGLIPEDWEVKKFNKFSKFYSGGTPLTSKSEYYGGEIPFIKSGEIYYDRTEQFLTQEGLNNSSAKLVYRGDLLYALYGANSGEVAISIYNLKGELVFEDAVISNAGAFNYTWSGNTTDGSAIPTGTYLCKMQTSAGVYLAKLMKVQ